MPAPDARGRFAKATPREDKEEKENEVKERMVVIEQTVKGEIVDTKGKKKERVETEVPDEKKKEKETIEKNDDGNECLPVRLTELSRLHQL